MRVKKFEAKSMKEALQMVKKELGPDAVILSARDNRKSFGIGGNASVEITAAVSEGTLQKKNFAESRLPAQAKEQFGNSNARTQRAIIDKMVDTRNRRDQEDRDASAAASSRRPITSQSYIDIEDEVAPTPRRSSALERATGRNVADLLQDFEQDFGLNHSATQATRARAAAQPAPRAQAPRAQAPAPTYQAEESGVADRAMARIKSAAREAWKNNPFAEEEAPAASTPTNRSQNYGRTGAPAQSATSARATAAAAAPRASGGLELVTEEFQEYSIHASASPNQAPNQVPPQTVPQGAREIASLKGEINRLQSMLETFQKVPQSFTHTTMHPGADYGVGYDYSFMFQKLSEAGLSVENSVEILKHAQNEIDPLQAKKRPIVDAWVARWFLNHIHVNPTPYQGRIHMFVGGAGSGKTTSLVKMAAQLVVKEKKKVAILSTDSSKVGAVDQMKIYCQILNVPFAVIRNKTDWEWVLGQLRGVDHVLVDFPGTQLRDLNEIHSFKALLPPEGFAPITHLCISATSKDGDADEMARKYKIAEPNDLIFTNLDQSVQHGIIYNLQRKTGLPLNSFGIGNRIPEDFEPASKERVLDLIFKLTKLKRGES